MVISRSARNVAAGLVLSLGIQLLATPAIALTVLLVPLVALAVLGALLAPRAG